MNGCGPHFIWLLLSDKLSSPDDNDDDDNQHLSRTYMLQLDQLIKILEQPKR